jgi:hypothetical protein
VERPSWDISAAVRLRAGVTVRWSHDAIVLSVGSFGYAAMALVVIEYAKSAIGEQAGGLHLYGVFSQKAVLKILTMVNITSERQQ